MAKQDKSKLKDWFTTGKYPTQEQFWDWMDSYIHRDDQLRITANFPELDGVLQQKVDKEVFKHHFENDNNPHNVTKQQVGLGSVDNTMDIDKPVSMATQTALDLKADKTAMADHLKDDQNPHKVTKQQVGLGKADNTADLDKPVSRDTQTALYLKADREDLSRHLMDNANPHRVSKLQVGLGHVDDTADVDKPISTATQTALDLKADKTYVDTLNEALQTRVSKLEQVQLIPGMIMAWKGSISSIPTGWQLCQALKDRFILGAGGDFQVGAMDGARTHQLTIEEMPSHKHQINDMVIPNISNKLGIFASGDSSKSKVSTSNTDAIGGSQPHNNMPPYYALAYIEYVGSENSAA